MPIEPGFAMTVHKAQGQTMGCVIIDLMGCFGTELPYVMVSRAMSLDGLIVLQDFDMKQISKQRSEDLRKEFDHLRLLRLQTIAHYGTGVEMEEAKAVLAKQGQKALARGTEQRGTADDRRRVKVRRIGM